MDRANARAFIFKFDDCIRLVSRLPAPSLILFPFLPQLRRLMKQDYSIFQGNIFSPFQRGIGQGYALRFFIMVENN
jgi:hypothetical protein